LAGIQGNTDHFLAAVSEDRTENARQYDYLFPIYYQVSTLLAEGRNELRHGGLYAGLRFLLTV